MSDGPLSPEEVAHRGFGTTFRGFDTGEVRAYLQRVANELKAATARERELHKRVADADHRAAHPVLEGDALTRALGDEMGRILASAQEAANGLKDKAEENVARILRDAHDQAQRIRAKAEAILAVRTEEADAEAAEIRRAAVAEAASVVERAGAEASAAMADVEARARQLVLDAQAARARVLGDLTRRRRLLQTQVEQLRAGRDRLLEAYRKVRSTTDEVADELQRVEAEARDAAGVVGERMAAAADADDMDDVLAAFAAESSGAAEGAGPVDRPLPGGGVDPSLSGDPPVGGAGAAEQVPVEVKAEVAAQLAGQAADDADAAEVAAVEATEERPAQLVSTRPGGERRALRLLRRPKDGRPLDAVPAPSDDEAVRVLPPATEPVVAAAAASAPPGTRPVVPAAASVPPAQPTGALAMARSTGGGDADGGNADEPARPAGAGGTDAEAVAAAVAGVDELFARIRAGRADAVARAHEVLAADPGAPAQLPATPEASPDGNSTPDDGAGDAGGPAEEETLLRRRDAAVEGLEAKLARKLKRALQDEQNEVLDRLRSAKAGAAPESVLPAPAEQAERYRQAAEEPLQASAAAGMAFVSRAAAGPDSSDLPDMAAVVNELVSSLAEPLWRALERAMRSDGADQSAVGERIGAAYRECKAQRIEVLAGDAVTAAFSRGALAALPPGLASRWVVDDDGRPCPDCDDNALAGPTTAGEAFPTGQAHPPAHAGCRCLLAPAELAAAAAGDG